MLPYSQGIILDNTQNYGIMKTETVFGFGPSQQSLKNSFNSSAPLEWIFDNGSFQKRSLQAEVPSAKQIKTKSKSSKKRSKKSKKGKKRQSKKVNKCVIKFLKKGQKESGEAKKRRRGGNKYQKMQKKYLMPMLLGLLAAKSILIPIALKALAFMSAKGLVLGFFSTVLASVMSLKGMFNHPYEYQNRKDDSKTQVEIIQVPTKSEDHVYYDDVHYRRGDYNPYLIPNMPNLPYQPNLPDQANEVMLNKKTSLYKKGLKHVKGNLKNFSSENNKQLENVAS